MMAADITYQDIIAAGAAGLAESEFWVIDHADGPIWDTASKQLDHPVRVFCLARDCDWDVATENGFFLNRLHREPPHVPL